jgi:hypothetical protein
LQSIDRRIPHHQARSRVGWTSCVGANLVVDCRRSLWHRHRDQTDDRCSKSLACPNTFADMNAAANADCFKLQARFAALLRSAVTDRSPTVEQSSRVWAHPLKKCGGLRTIQRWTHSWNSNLRESCPINDHLGSDDDRRERRNRELLPNQIGGVPVTMRPQSALSLTRAGTTPSATSCWNSQERFFRFVTERHAQ